MKLRNTRGRKYEAKKWQGSSKAGGVKQRESTLIMEAREDNTLTTDGYTALTMERHDVLL